MHLSPFEFRTPPRIVFGPGSALRLGELCAERGIARALMVTDGGVRALAEPALKALREAGVALAVFDRVLPDPPEAVFLQAVSAARDHAAEAVIGFGGGSSLDVAKVAALLASSGEALREIYGVGLAKGPRLPLFCVPTTAGTGSEVTAVSVVTTDATEKRGVVAPVLIPDIAVLDPDLTLGLPAPVTAATGIDAMVHAIEAYTSTHANNNPVSRLLAREALSLLGAHIERAVHDGGDIEARGAMLLGATLAGQAFANSPVAGVHALAYPLGGHYGLPHGLTNALVLPHVLRFNAPAAGAAYGELAPLVFPDLIADPDTDTFAERLLALAASLGLATTLKAAGIPRADLALLARDAMLQGRLLQNNPRSIAEPDALRIYEAAYG